MILLVVKYIGIEYYFLNNKHQYSKACWITIKNNNRPINSIITCIFLVLIVFTFVYEYLFYLIKYLQQKVFKKSCKFNMTRFKPMFSLDTFILKHERYKVSLQFLLIKILIH